MKMYKIVKTNDYLHQAEQEEWDRYSQTRNPADKPAGTGPTPHVVMTNRRSTGAKRWSKKA